MFMRSATSILLAAVLTTLCSNQSHAACSGNYELKGSFKENIQKILDFGRCVKQEQKARVGKWFCFVSDMAGIQGDKGNVFAGRLKPKDEKFFVTISEITDDEKRDACELTAYGLSGNLEGYFGNNCLGNYRVELSVSTSAPFVASPQS